MTKAPNYWFPAKRFGWGWGLPITWQGWVVLAIFFAFVVVGILLFPPHRSPVAFILYVAVLSVLLVVVCWIKGEPPGWRWG